MKKIMKHIETIIPVLVGLYITWSLVAGLFLIGPTAPVFGTLVILSGLFVPIFIED